MRIKRTGAVMLALLVLSLLVAVAQAGAQGPSTVLKFHNAPSSFAAIGFNANNPNAIPPVGSQEVIVLHLQNIGSQFGKPSGATVGRVLLDCTVLAVNSPTSIDGYCSGIAHVPNGYFTFAGNGGFSNAPVNYFAVTGGIGPYASDRGEIKVVNHSNGSSDATITLSS